MKFKIDCFPYIRAAGNNLRLAELYSVSTGHNYDVAGTYTHVPKGDSAHTMSLCDFPQPLEIGNSAMSNNQFNAFPLWQTVAFPVPSNEPEVPPQNINGGTIVSHSTSSLKKQRTSIVDLGGSSSHAHNLIDLRTASPTAMAHLVVQTPDGYHCKLSNCTSPFRVFPCEAAVIEHIRCEDALTAKPQGVWCIW